MVWHLVGDSAKPFAEPMMTGSLWQPIVPYGYNELNSLQSVSCMNIYVIIYEYICNQQNVDHYFLASMCYG